MSRIQVDLFDIDRLRQTWARNQWNENEDERAVFNSFCRLFPHFSEDQKELIHELTENYLWITGSEYEKRFGSLITMLGSGLKNENSQIFIFPIIRPSDENRVKSGNHCCYLIKSVIALKPAFREKDVVVISSFKDFNDISFTETDILLLVDDFVGSGDTFAECWHALKKNISVPNAQKVVLCIAMQNEAREYIDTLGLKVLTTEARGKGITDFYQPPILEEKIKLMEEIEAALAEVPPLYSFGYKRSEALITLARTPDNTFPFFWMRYSIKGESLDGPFFRKE